MRLLVLSDFIKASFLFLLHILLLVLKYMTKIIHRSHPSSTHTLRAPTVSCWLSWVTPHSPDPAQIPDQHSGFSHSIQKRTLTGQGAWVRQPAPYFAGCWLSDWAGKRDQSSQVALQGQEAVVSRDKFQTPPSRGEIQLSQD